METLSKIVHSVNGILWDKNILLFLLVGTGIWYSIQLKFIQITGFGEGFRRTFGGLFKKSEKASAEGMSQFQSLATAIAAQVGTGNLAGAATAIAVGGPGAIFWMWISAFFGMATIYAEATMAQEYKQIGEDKTVTGGPVYYIEAAFKGKFGKILAGSFAVFII
ncbi:MAG: alanine:cation symporter family protein, partial [Clostridium sp.]